MTKSPKRALALLRLPDFFVYLLLAVEKAGLVGEIENALIGFIVCVSRFLDTPLNLFIKGQSSSGKNFLARKILDFVPKQHVFEISNATDAAWNYQGKRLMHKIIYEQEMDRKRGSMHQSRLLVSEKQLRRSIVVWKNGKRITKTQVTKGPVACISTSTVNQFQIDEENRRFTIRPNESQAQTQRIMERLLQNSRGLSEDEIKTWHGVQRLLGERAKTPIDFPEWMSQVARYFPSDDIRARRYFPAFLQGVRTVCLIRSFRRRDDQVRYGKPLRVKFSDFAIAAIIFEKAFRDSLSNGEIQDKELLDCIQKISITKRGKGAGTQEVARRLGISYDAANRRIKKAEAAGSIRRTNKPMRGNSKLYAVTPARKYLPNPEEVFQNINHGLRKVKFVHPLTGRWITYAKRKEVTA